jgi:hypothetical protein
MLRTVKTPVAFTKTNTQVLCSELSARQGFLTASLTQGGHHGGTPLNISGVYKGPFLAGGSLLFMTNVVY